MEISDKKLEEIVRAADLLTPDQLAQAQAKQKEAGGTLQAAVLALELLDLDTLVSTVLTQSDISHIRVKNYPIPPEVTALVPRDKCLTYTAVPVSLSDDLLTVAMHDPLNVVTLDDLRTLTKKVILPVYAPKDEIRYAIDKHYPKDKMSITDVAVKIDSEYAHEKEQVKVNESDDENSPVIVTLTNKIVEDAYHQGASDIHIEHYEDKVSVRLRVDGTMREVLALPTKARNALVARLKIMASMDISEKRLPQDGRIVFKHYSKNKLDIDIRVSSMPTAHGEKVVMRILDKQRGIVPLDQMGFDPDTLATYRELIQRPWGMILHVGPTGSGKTTTLQSALAELNKPDVNIQTAEDPIEYLIPGINQVQVHPDIGFTFARTLRGFMRQDPDIILIGEIRDLETAKIATEAALTGHMLFSTLHTNDAPQTVTRLVEMGMEPFLLSATLVGVCAQRLIRKLCRCKQRYEPTAEERRILELGDAVPFLYKPRGCEHCRNTGYKGRIGVHELLVMNDEIRQAVNLGKPALEIKRIAEASGMRTLKQNAVRKVIGGITSVEEVVAVISLA